MPRNATTPPVPSSALARTRLECWTLTVRGPLDGVPEPARAALEDGLELDAPVTTLAALVAAGLVGDVTVDAHEEDVAWVGALAWEYRARVARPAGASYARLVLHGIDTVGRILVDGEVRLEVADMFHPHVVDLDPADGEDDWDVRVQVDAALPVARAAEAADPRPRADMYELPYNQVRKMACSFGWDWGPVTITNGLWRPVVLESWTGPRLEGLRLTAGLAAGDQGVLRLTAAAGLGAVDLVVRLEGRGDPVAVLPVAEGHVTAELPVDDVRRWDPVGLGEQPLYDVTVELRDEAGAVVDREVRRIGFRSVELRRQPDADGESFELVVNGTRVWARGFNWIPPHVLPETVTREHVHHLVSEAVAAGANILRVWGGGIFESDDFYDVCDELGMLVWQDFPFACATYREDPETTAHVRAEAAGAVARLGHRTSLVLWCGCNENLGGFEDWGWKETLDGRPWGATFYHDVLPTVLAELDPTRPYIPGSPFSPGDAHPNDPAAGPTHHWDTWNEIDYTAFDEKRSRFASEFGWQAPAGWPSLVRALGGEPTGADDPRLPRLQKAFRGMESLGRGIAAHLPETAYDGRGWWLAAQVVQARAVRAAIGSFRSQHDTCSGAVWWQLDDCWPALSWAVLDVTGRRRLAWYAMREVLAPRAVVPTAAEAGALTLVNDTRDVWESLVTIVVATTDGRVLAREQIQVQVPALGHLVVGSSLAAGAEDHADTALVMVDADGHRGVRWLRPDAELGQSAARVQVSLERSVPGSATLRVRALDLVRDLVLLAEIDPRLDDSLVDDQLHTALPCEFVSFTVTGARVGELSVEEWGGLLAATGPLHVVPWPLANPRSGADRFDHPEHRIDKAGVLVRVSRGGHGVG